MLFFIGCTPSLQFEVNGTVAIMNGELTSDAPDQVATLLEENPNIEWIELQNCPGSLDDHSALEASRMIRSANINTRVPINGEIASGAVDFFIAGVQRTVVEGGKVGVHSWSNGDVEGSEVPESDSEHDLYLNFYEDMGISSDFYWFTLNAASSDGLHYMTQDELREYELINTD
tara:strand:+ start:522 stop:1043 length:522 start_codon:yes stop_codon:yes gene_type:complete